MVRRKGDLARAVFWALVTACCGVWASSFVLPEASAEPGRRAIDVTIAGDLETTSALQFGILEFAAQRDVGVSWQLEPEIRPRDVLGEPTAGASVFARIWLDVSADRQAVIYIVDTSSDRILRRVVPLEAGYDEVARESLGNIVESAIDALLAGAEIGERREVVEAQVAAESAPADPVPKAVARPEPRPPPRPAEPRTEPPGIGLGVLLGYRAESLHGAEALRHGPELGGVLELDGSGWSTAAWLLMGYRLESTWRTEEIELGLHGAGARGLFGFVAPKAVLRPYFGLGAGVDATRIEAVPRSPAISARAPSWIVAPIGVAALGVRWHLVSSLRLSLTGFGEVDLRGHHFDVVREGRVEPVLKPWPVRPSAVLAFEAGLE